MEYRAKAQRGTAVSLFLLIYALLLGITATVVPPETSGLILEGIKNSALLEILKENLWEETPQGYLQKTLGFKQKNDEEGKLSQEYALWLLTGAKVNDPYSLMLAGYPVLNGGEEKFGDIDEGEDFPVLPGEPLVVIFCTHTGESYEGDGGRERAPKGERGEVLEVARELSQKLEEKGIKTILIEKVHDSDYNRSYSEAKKTVLDLLEVKSLKLIIDVHRDSEASPKYRTVNVMGEELAPIIFVIGKGERLPQPHWQENELVTKKIIAETETIYPGLIRGIRYKSGRFNQHLSSYLVLVEIGNVSNSLAQAKKSADLLAEGIARYLLR